MTLEPVTIFGVIVKVLDGAYLGALRDQQDRNALASQIAEALSEYYSYVADTNATQATAAQGSINSPLPPRTTGPVQELPTRPAGTFYGVKPDSPDSELCRLRKWAVEQAVNICKPVPSFSSSAILGLAASFTEYAMNGKKD